MFSSLLIANRGEIACRVTRTAKRMGMRVIAVYSEADKDAMHVRIADEAHLIGPAAPRESYLSIEKIIAAAKTSGAEAIHPGYGFLSENAAFAEACAKAKIVFVGPPARAILAMGDKARSKILMEKAGVPLVPGYHGEDQSEKTLKSAAGKIGYPVLIKASAGGGGKGMKIVERAEDFAAALASAKREAASSFGDERVLVEKYLTKPRHIEMQVFADSQGNCIHLFERDCSIQRRHQKVLEEAPAPGMTEKRRAEMGKAAVAAAKTVGYVGAGTVEFISDPSGAFYFMEMNTRLQVEHPVTEMITGQDLVEWQLRVASGEKLPLKQDQVKPRGHAIEARLYAEDPDRDFLPSTGTLAHLQFPSAQEHVRVDTGVRAGDAISIHYDPMIAKLVVWGEDRRAAVKRLAASLDQCQAVGPATNIAFLARVARHKAYGASEVDTGFISRHRRELLPDPKPATDRELALAALALLLMRVEEAKLHATASADPWSPWHASDGWRLNGDNHHMLTFRDPARVDAKKNDPEIAVTAHFRPGGYRLDLPGGAVDASGTLTGSTLAARLAGTLVNASAVRVGDRLHIILGSETQVLLVIDPLAGAADRDIGAGKLQAPMPGKVTAVHVKSGAKVKRGQPLLVLEAMKMEHAINAPADGTVKELRFAVGEQVPEGAELIVFEAEG